MRWSYNIFIQTHWDFFSLMRLLKVLLHDADSIFVSYSKIQLYLLSVYHSMVVLVLNVFANKTQNYNSKVFSLHKHNCVAGSANTLQQQTLILAHHHSPTMTCHKTQNISM